MASSPDVAGPAALRALRARHRLTQKDVARICASTERSVQRWEADPGTPSHRAIPEAAWRLLRVTVGECRAKPAKARPSRAAPARTARTAAPSAPVAAPPAAPAPPPNPPPREPQATLGLAAGPRRRSAAELARLRRLAQASK